MKNEPKISIIFDSNRKIIDFVTSKPPHIDILFTLPGEEVGWVYESDFYPDDPEKTYKLINK